MTNVVITKEEGRPVTILTQVVQREIAVIAQEGIQGPKGDTGATGPQGPQGIPGPKGDNADPYQPFECVVTSNVSSPPTTAELTALFGNSSVSFAKTVVKTGGDEAWLVTYDSINRFWWITALTQAESGSVIVNPPEHTYYVAVNGNNNNDGSYNSPWATITYGASQLTPGDALEVRGGTYTVTSTINVSGESDNPILIKAADNELVIIDRTSAWTSRINSNNGMSDGSSAVYINGQYVIFDGFEIRYCPGNCITAGAHTEIRNCNLHHCLMNAIMVDGSYVWIHDNDMHDLEYEWYYNHADWGAAVAPTPVGENSSDLLIENNRIWHCYGEGLNVFNVIRQTLRGNECWDCLHNGIVIGNTSYSIADSNKTYYTADKTWWIDPDYPADPLCYEEEPTIIHHTNHHNTFINNLVWGGAHSFHAWNGGVNYGGGMSFAMINVVVAGNTFINPQGPSRYSIYIEAPTNVANVDTFIENNICYNGDRAPACFIGDMSGITFRNNCWSASPGSQYVVNNSLAADPKLIAAGASVTSGNLDANNYKLASDSPCIDHGYPESLLAKDFFGGLRSGSLDIGFHEYGSASEPEPPIELVVDIDFETNDLSQVSGSSGNPTVSAAAALAGSGYGLLCQISDTTPRYIYSNYNKNAAVAERVYVDPNTLTMGAADEFTIWKIIQNGGSNLNLVYVILTRNSGNYYLHILVYNDSQSLVYEAFTSAPIADASHYVDVVMLQATNSSSADGSVQWWVDGVSQGSITLDNFNLMSDQNLRSIIGACSGIDAGTSGSLYMDELAVAYISTPIGPV